MRNGYNAYFKDQTIIQQIMVLMHNSMSVFVDRMSQIKLQW